jgi:hypothetical protein
MPIGPALSSAGRKLRARHALLTRWRGPDDPKTAEAARDYRAQRLADTIQRAVAAAPPLTHEQVEQLRGLLPYPYPCAPAGDQEAATAC